MINNSTNVQIGGTAAVGNVISGNGKENEGDANKANGVMIVSSDFTRIQGNRIGTNSAETAEVPNHGDGVSANSGSSTLVGGTAAEGNRIAGNKKLGVSGKATDINNNKIGIKEDGTALPNLGGGIALNGNGATVSQNEVGYNGGPGIAVLSGTGHSFTENSIHDNAGAGIRVLAGSNNLAYLNTITSNAGGGIHLPAGSTASTFRISQNTLDSLLVADGSVEVVGLSPVTAVALSGGGNITGASVLEVLGSMNWTGGSQTGSGRTDVASAASLAMNTSLTLALQRTLHNYGAASWAGSGRIALDAEGVFLNQSSGAFTASGTGTLGSDDGTGAFTNLGTYTQAGVMAPPSFADLLAFANFGTVQVNAFARLALVGTYEQTAGSTTLSPAGNLAVEGSFTQSGGTVSAMGFGTILSVTGPYQQTGGTSTYGGTGGRLSVNGSATVGGDAVLTLSNGLLDATGLIAIQSGATLNGFGGGITGNVVNAGLLNLVGGAAGLYSLSITGTYTQTGTLRMGLASGSYSQLSISGAATLGGLLDVDGLGGYAPGPGSYFQLLNYGSVSGAFGSFDLPPLSFGVWRYNYNPTNFVLWVSYF